MKNILLTLFLILMISAEVSAIQIFHTSRNPWDMEYIHELNQQEEMREIQRENLRIQKEMLNIQRSEHSRRLFGW